MYTEMKTTIRRNLIVASVAGLITLVTFAAPLSWQTRLTQTVVSPASASGNDTGTQWRIREYVKWRLIMASVGPPLTAFPPAHWPKPKTTQWNVSSDQKAVSVEIGVADKKPGIDIPDDNRPGVNIPIEIADPHGTGSPAITQVDIHLNIEHRWLSDLVVSLINPDGVTATLYNRMAPQGVNILSACSIKGMKITLVETASEARRLDSTLCPSASNKRRTVAEPPGSTVYAPAKSDRLEGLFQTPSQALKEFNGHTPHGTWILNISDHALADRGTLTAAALTVVSAP